MRWFLQRCHPFTRSLRILVGAWRWVESAQCRRLEIGVEETMVRLVSHKIVLVARAAYISFFYRSIVKRHSLAIVSPVCLHELWSMVSQATV